MTGKSILNTILRGRCPRCRKGRMYKVANSYNIFHLYKMHENCSNCNVKFKMEPSFFFGAMYISYGLSVVLAIIAFLISRLVFHFLLVDCFVVIVCLLMICFPVIGRLSRNIWIVLFVKYDPNVLTKQIRQTNKVL